MLPQAGALTLPCGSGCGCLTYSGFSLHLCKMERISLSFPSHLGGVMRNDII